MRSDELDYFFVGLAFLSRRKYADLIISRACQLNALTPGSRMNSHLDVKGFHLKDDAAAPCELLGIMRKRFHQKRIQENDQEDDDERAQVDPAKTGWRDESPHRPEERLSQLVKNESEGIKGGNIHPG